MNPGWDNPNPKYGYKGKNPLKSIMQVPNRTSLTFFRVKNRREHGAQQ